MIEQKIRESCYCDCRNKKDPTFKKLKTRKIGYEDENGILPSDDEEDNEFIPDNTRNDPIDGCACTCHGMYDEENQPYKSTRQIPLVYYYS